MIDASVRRGGLSLLLKDRFADAFAGISMKQKSGGAASMVRHFFTKKLPYEFDLFQITRTPCANEQM
ncbi:MAG TPA: hypothetical protein VIX17_11045 [Pyrinomonadaceae bacterium]|jgi:hypothetical protein